MTTRYRQTQRNATPRRLRFLAWTGAIALATGACATTGATFRSGVGDTFLEHPPWYAGAAVSPDTIRAGHLPVAWQQGASQAPIFDPSLSGPLAELLDEMTAYLDSLGISSRLVEGGHVAAVSSADTRFPPDVQLGCPTTTGAPDDDCAEREGEAAGRGRQPLRLAVGRPSPQWTAWMRQVLHDAGADAAIVLTLEVGQYWIRQRGWRGTKEVELGTSHTVTLPWLTSLETPVTVLQLTGALVGPDGKAIRIGGEGLLALRTPIPVSSIGGQRVLTDEDVARFRTARRQDLSGEPLVWKEGLRTLVERLTGRVPGSVASR